jgi:Na+/glutamate symporter
MSSTNKNNNKELLKYAGLTMQLFAAIGISLFIGYKADQWLRWKFPLFVWLLPVIVIIGTIIKIFKDTTSKK